MCYNESMNTEIMLYTIVTFCLSLFFFAMLFRNAKKLHWISSIFWGLGLYVSVKLFIQYAMLL